MDCINCGKIFLGDNRKFCSMQCFKEYSDDFKKDNQSMDKKDFKQYQDDE